LDFLELNTHCEWVFVFGYFVMKKEKEIAQFALDYALKNGCQHAKVVLAMGEENEVEVRDGKVNRLHHSGGCQLTLSLYVDGSYSSISTNRLDREELARFIDKGIISTRYLAADPYRCLPEKELYYSGEGNDFGLLDEGYDGVDVDEKIGVTRAIFDEIVDERVISASAMLGDNVVRDYMVDSGGFEGDMCRSQFAVSAQVCVSGEGDERPEDYAFVTSALWQGLKREGVGADALSRVVGKIGASRIDSGVYSVVVDRRVAAQLVSPLLSALKGEALHMKSSFLLDRKGEKIASDVLTIVDNPHQEGKIGARLFDRDGIAVREMKVVEKGVLCDYYISHYMSKKMGVEMTRGITTVLDFEHGVCDTAGLIAKMGTGVLVTGFNGGNCNGTTGDFSYGIEGYWVENGVIVRPISEMLMTGNMLELWMNLVDTSNDPMGYSAWNVPSLLFTDVVVN
jgi:PmbA protein